MDVEHLRTAFALVRHGTVNRTAAALGIAASSVSDRIRRLENELDSGLFTRDHAGMRPTAAGRMYLAAAEEAVDSLDEAARRLANGGSAVIVGAQASIADTLLPAVLADLERRRPDVVVRVQPETERARLLASLERDEIHAAVLLDAGPAIGDLGYPTPGVDLEHLDLREVPMVTVTDPSSALRGRPVSPSEIRDDATLIGRESRCSFWMATQRWLGPNTDLTAVGGLAQVREWVAAGRGIAVLPDFAVRNDVETGRLEVLDVATPPLQLRLVWRGVRGEVEPVRSLLYALSLA